MTTFTHKPRLADSVPTALINASINATIAWFGFKNHERIPLSVDSIGAHGVTALGNAATVAFALTFILTCITFFIFRHAARKSGEAAQALQEMRFWPTGLKVALLNTLLAFGVFVASAVLWQRFAGTVLVSPLAAALVVALVAAASTAFAELRTKREMLAASGA